MDIQQPQASRSRRNGDESDESVVEELSVSDGLANDDLCEACQNITLESLGCSAEMVPELLSGSTYAAEYDLIKVHGYEYPHTVGDLDELCRRCTLCDLIRKTVYCHGDPLTVISRDKTSRFKLSFFMHGGTGCLKIHLASAISSKFDVQKDATPLLLRLFTDPDNEENFAHLALGRSIVPPDSEIAYRRIQSSVEHCLRHHPICSRTMSGTVAGEENPLPTRVVDVCLDNNSDIRVREMAGLRGKYVALSYCWGEPLSSPELMLTKATIEQLLLNLPAERLPKTIQDAINITRRLGMNYLWVDRLCIIQDDQTDWQNEAAKMGSVYENAVFTIVALGAHTPEDGCFLPREEKTLVATLLTERGNLHISGIPAPIDSELRVREFELEMSRSRWAFRAWTFQERIFSRRVIYYGGQQIIWECRNLRETETQFGTDAGFKYRCSKFLHAQDPKSTINRAITERGPVDCERMDFSNLWGAEDGADWEGLAAMYSQLQLSYEKDRIPAIQSLMQHVEETTGIECCAGMWLGSLSRTLFWWPFWWDEREIERGISPRSISRSSKDGVPSWSWLAAGCPVSFYSWIKVDKMTLERPKLIRDEPPKLEFWAHITDGRRSGRARAPMMIKSFHEKWNGFPDSHRNGLLDRWEGNVYDLIHRDCSRTTGRVQRVLHRAKRLVLSVKSEDRTDGLICFDDSEDLPESFKCAILGAGGAPVRGLDAVGLNIFMLVLVPTGLSDEYRRIGIAYRCVPLDCDYARSFPDRRRIRLV